MVVTANLPKIALGEEVNGAADALGEDLTQTIQAGCEFILGEIEWW